MHGLNELREQGRMTWIEAERGWGATSRRDLRPAGGVWQGVNT